MLLCIGLKNGIILRDLVYIGDRHAETDHEVTAEENAFDIEAEEIVECSEDIEE